MALGVASICGLPVIHFLFGFGERDYVTLPVGAVVAGVVSVRDYFVRRGSKPDRAHQALVAPLVLFIDAGLFVFGLGLGVVALVAMNKTRTI